MLAEDFKIRELDSLKVDNWTVKVTILNYGPLGDILKIAQIKKFIL